LGGTGFKWPFLVGCQRGEESTQKWANHYGESDDRGAGMYEENYLKRVDCCWGLGGIAKERLARYGTR